MTNKHSSKTIDNMLYETAFKSLAKMKCPDFSEYDSDTVFESFHRLYHEENCSKFICDSVNAYEGGVIIPANFNTGVMGPSKPYFLKNHEKTIKVVFGPYDTPFLFIGEKEE